MFGGELATRGVQRGELRRMVNQVRQDPVLSADDIREMVHRHLDPDTRVIRQPLRSPVDAGYVSRNREAPPAVVYHPLLGRRSVIKHEIGHGLQDRDRKLVHRLYGPSRALGPTTSAIGAALAASGNVRVRTGLGLAAAGLIGSAPHLIEEAQATRRAREMMGDRGHGLTPAFRTYLHNAITAPVFAGGGVYGVRRLSRLLRRLR